MEYLKVMWIHDVEEYPILLISEIDYKRYEVRKIEVYRDNSFGLAMPNFEFGGTLLGSAPVPPIDEIKKDSQFILKYISKQEFEEVWREHIGLIEKR